MVLFTIGFTVSINIEEERKFKWQHENRVALLWYEVFYRKNLQYFLNIDVLDTFITTSTLKHVFNFLFLCFRDKSWPLILIANFEFSLKSN